MKGALANARLRVCVRVCVRARLREYKHVDLRLARHSGAPAR